ncbi:hypothetical protein BDV24DRAFT_26635 [Aspergillus arachidicola]|uniref:Uncharacterized protein n=1 Tax=Aspergillus arachidicola TaxID=656916 RepID=A0A5N6XMI8_9EURO|nr:hypothetical protein BDV24DRAFT_26635 [Aspergillus arachidicola]
MTIKNGHCNIKVDLVTSGEEETSQVIMENDKLKSKTNGLHRLLNMPAVIEEIKRDSTGGRRILIIEPADQDKEGVICHCLVFSIFDAFPLYSTPT